MGGSSIQLGSRRLLTPSGLLAGGLTSAVAAASFLIGSVQSRGAGLFNDFYDYWAASRILMKGGDPYEVGRVAQTLAAAGVHSTVGGGYSYPLLLADLGQPLALLPPLTAAVLFTVGSFLALWLAIGVLLSPLRQLPRFELLGLAGALGLFAPLVGTFYFGQVNHYVLLALALGYRRLRPSAAIVAAAAVKLYPAAAALAFLTEGRRGWRSLLMTLGVTGALVLGPNLATGRWSYGGGLLWMLGPDPFWSNESINGFLSRLALPSEWGPPPLPGLPVTPVMLIAGALLGGITILLVTGRLRGSWEAGFCLLLCYGALSAPKNSLWNFAPLVLALVYLWPLVRQRRVAATAAVLALLLLDGYGPTRIFRDWAPALSRAWISGVPLYGGLLLGALLAWSRPPASVEASLPDPEEVAA